MNLPAVDVGREARTAAEDVEPGPLKVAIPNEVSISPDRDGQWEALPEGGRIWRYRFRARGATDLNFGFTTFRLPPGASLHIYSDTERYQEGPYTSGDNKPHGELWTPMVPGDRATIELFVPDHVEFAPELELSRVSAGFSDFLGRSRRPSLMQDACNIDVACPEANRWRDEIRSVATMMVDGFVFCTGTLINDVPESFTPFFLTAAHCGITAQQARRIVFVWNFESPNCGDLGGGSRADNQTGSTFRASRADVDFTLLELDNLPERSFNVHFTGWDRSGVVPRGSVGIHHPRGDEKAISFNDDSLVTIDGNSCIGGPGINTHWDNDWERGTAEPGSSGSGLWDAATQRLVGFLSGGVGSCSSPPILVCYGKFSVAWDGPSAARRLKDHLDPQNTGVLTVDGADPEVATVINDDFANATRLRGRSGSVTGTSIGATSQIGEPIHAGVVGGKSVWWKWRAPRTEPMVFSTARSNFDTVLAIYSGSRVAQLRELVSNDDGSGLGLQSQVRLQAVAGRLYRIAVDGYRGAEGDVVLRFRPPSGVNVTANTVVSD